MTVSLSASVAVTVTEVRPLDATVIGRVPLVVSVSSAAARVTVCAVLQLLRGERQAAARRDGDVGVAGAGRVA